MKKLNPIILVIVTIVFYSCSENPNTGADTEKTTSILNINGYVQKGPFLNGTAITISELNSDLSPTGKNFTSQLLDNKGTFEISNVELTTQYVELMANGFYFNEVENSNSAAQLTLFAISDVSEKSSLNVNILSNLEKGRVVQLISEGMEFSGAKDKAQSEILSIFNIDSVGLAESEYLDISKSGDDNAVLLAVSVILQGYLTVSDLSELMANISTDIREDGQLNSESLSSALINNAKALDLAEIRENLENRYELLGFEVTVPNFEKYVQQFIDSTDFEFTEFIEYPQTGKHGTNILFKEKTEYTPGTYSMKAVIPEGNNLKVKISGDNWFYPAFQDNTGWEDSDWNNAEKSRFFTSTRTGEVDFEILFESFNSEPFNIKIDVYENDDLEPTRTKEITVSNSNTSDKITFPAEGLYGKNILALENGMEINDTGAYSITVAFADEPDLYIRFKLNDTEGQVNWSVNESKLVNWSAPPEDGREIKAMAQGENADMEIVFTGEGRVQAEISMYKANYESDTYLGSKSVEFKVIKTD